jgi:hypothetical protein
MKSCLGGGEIPDWPALDLVEILRISNPGQEKPAVTPSSPPPAPPPHSCDVRREFLSRSNVIKCDITEIGSRM